MLWGEMGRRESCSDFESVNVTRGLVGDEMPKHMFPGVSRVLGTPANSEGFRMLVIQGTKAVGRECIFD